MGIINLNMLEEEAPGSVTAVAFDGGGHHSSSPHGAGSHGVNPHSDDHQGGGPCGDGGHQGSGPCGGGPRGGGLDYRKANSKVNFRGSVQVIEIVNLARSTFAMVVNTIERASARY